MSLTPKARKDKLGRGGLAEVARSTGYKPGHVSQVNNGLRPHRRTEVAIARKLRMKVTEAFPEYYPQKQNGQAIGA